MAAQDKKARPSANSSAASPSTTPCDGPDRLTKLPAEILDWIFFLAAEKKAPHLPICKKLLPFQRRRYTRVLLPNKYDLEHAKSLLSHADSLQSLTFLSSSDIPEALSALSKPERLETLCFTRPGWSYPPLPRVRREHHYRPLPVLGADATPAFARLTGLKTLQLDTPVDLSNAGLVAALHKTRIETLQLGDATSIILAAAHLTPLVCGATKLAHLQKLELDFVSGESGTPASECTKDWHFDDWEMPDWPAQFPRADLEKLVKEAEVKVEGLAIEAMGIEDEYEVEKKEWNKEKMMNGRRRHRR
ncbi:hypothetical protein JCM6882_001543 [Rhodosporidiobolus microsporus]